MRKSQIILVVIIGILTLSFVSVSVYGSEGRGTDVNIRPIEDWLANNPFGAGMQYNTAFVGHDKDGMYYWTFFDSLYGAFTGNLYEYDGHVKEKVKHDGSIEITVKLWVEDIYMEAYDALLDENGDPVFTMNYFGDVGDIVLYAFMDYYFEFKFILAAEYPGYEPWGIPPGTREAGCPLPYSEAIYNLAEPLGIEVVSMSFIGYGEGEMFEPGWRWPPPGEEFPPGPFIIGDAKILMFFHARFHDNPLLWPAGSSGFRMNRIMYW
jgi:hypothetical protein